jgi:hypothetical protein
MKKTNHINAYETFKSINEGKRKYPSPSNRGGSKPQFNKFLGVSPEEITKKGLKSIITQNFFLDLWFDSYFKNTTEDRSYDYRKDEDFWNHTDELLNTLPVGYQEPNNSSAMDSYHDRQWSEVLNYISIQKPNPFTNPDALEDAINAALSDFEP